MSELTVGQLKGLTVNNNTITVPSGHKLYAPGSICQVVTGRYDTKATYSYSSNTILSALNISITPKFSNSLLIAEWNISYEAEYNAVFRIYRDGSLIQTSGYQGYNSTDGNWWSGVAPVLYDSDVASTPNSQFIRHIVPAGSTSPTTLQIGVNQSAGSSATFKINQSYSSSGANNYEVGICNMTIWEIAQ